MVKSANNQVTLQLKPVLPTLGPVSKYLIVVVNEEVGSLRLHQDTQLKSAAEARTSNLPYYVTAELTPQVRRFYCLFMSVWHFKLFIWKYTQKKLIINQPRSLDFSSFTVVVDLESITFRTR